MGLEHGKNPREKKLVIRSVIPLLLGNVVIISVTFFFSVRVLYMTAWAVHFTTCILFTRIALNYKKG